MVRINADLLHFQSAPSAPESSIGGVDLIGAKVAAQASVIKMGLGLTVPATLLAGADKVIE
jgi:hypothetical protein